MRALATSPVAVIACLVFASNGLAKNPVQTEGTLVAVLDVARVFEEHGRFKSRMEGIKSEVTDFENALKEERTVLQSRAETLQDYNPGSIEFKQMEAELAKADADLQIRAAQKRKEVLDKEAQIYYETYLEVIAAVERIAEANGIGLVLRYDSTPIDRSDRGSVIKGVNRNVVLNRGYDLTDMVVDLVNREGGVGTAQNPNTGVNR